MRAHVAKPYKATLDLYEEQDDAHRMSPKKLGPDRPVPPRRRLQAMSVGGYCARGWPTLASQAWRTRRRSAGSPNGGTDHAGWISLRRRSARGWVNRELLLVIFREAR
jgi:hypothetical protein